MKVIILLLVGFRLLFSSIDINTASEKELISLVGIGKSKAKAIVEYRKTHCFKSVNELVKVKGIGKKSLKKNKINLLVSECKK